MLNRKDSLQAAVANFPLRSWLESRWRVNGTSEEVTIECPNCGGKLGIDLNLKLFHCFRCDDGGHGTSKWNGKTNLVGFIKFVEQCDFRKAVDIIRKSSGIVYQPITIDLEQYRKTDKPESVYKMIDMNPKHEAVLKLKERGLEHLLPYLSVSVTGRYAQRFIIPCKWFEYRDGWEAKTYTKAKIKTLYPKWFRTSEWLYTSNDFDATNPVAVMSESIFDAETIRHNAIGLFGSRLLEGQMSLLLELKEMGITKLVWMLDHDAMKKQVKAIYKLTAPFFQNYIAKLPRDQDPNSYKYDNCWRSIEQSVKIRDELDLVRVLLEWERQ